MRQIAPCSPSPSAASPLLRDGLALPPLGRRDRVQLALALILAAGTPPALLAALALHLAWSDAGGAIAASACLLAAPFAAGAGISLLAVLQRRGAGPMAGVRSAHDPRWRRLRAIEQAGARLQRWLHPFTGRSAILRRLGAAVAPGAVIEDSVRVDDPLLVEVGADAVLDARVHLITATLIGDHVRLGRIRIGRDAVIGAGVVIHPDVEVGARAVLAPGTVVLPGTRIPAGGIWSGHPARPSTSPPAPLLPDETVRFRPAVLRGRFGGHPRAAHGSASARGA